MICSVKRTQTKPKNPEKSRGCFSLVIFDDLDSQWVTDWFYQRTESIFPRGLWLTCTYMFFVLCIRNVCHVSIVWVKSTDVKLPYQLTYTGQRKWGNTRFNSCPGYRACSMDRLLNRWTGALNPKHALFGRPVFFACFTKNQEADVKSRKLYDRRVANLNLYTKEYRRYIPASHTCFEYCLSTDVG